MEVEDDVFFADLSRRIALLIMDDDDDEEFPVQCPTSVTVQGFSHPQPIMPTPFPYEAICRRESKGTGVFIPQSSFPRRKTKFDRSAPNNNNNNNFHRQHHRSRATNNSPISSNYYSNSTMLKRH